MKRMSTWLSIAWWCAATWAVAAFGTAVAEESLTIVSWGGVYTQSQVEAYHKPFTEMTGVKILSEDYNGGLAQIKAQVDAGEVTWSLVDVVLSDALRGCEEGILERIPKSILPNALDGTPADQDFMQGMLHDCAVGTSIWATVFAFNGDQFAGDKPATLQDFFDTKTFPGKRGLRKSPRVNLEWALMADGVPVDKVYVTLSTEAGVDRAFAKLNTIKADTIWWDSGAQPPQWLAGGEVAMTSAYNGRLHQAVFKEDKPLVIVWEGQVWDLDLWVIPKGAKHLDTIKKFVAFSTDTQRLADQARYMSYGPGRKSSMQLVSDKVKPHLPNEQGNFKKALQNDFVWWAKNNDEMNKRFAAWLAEK